jgi:hypothetical protein|eukprot:COSAG02_NODE_1570_length_11893_cov_2.376717_11_plen_173_part_00
MSSSGLVTICCNRFQITGIWRRGRRTRRRLWHECRHPCVPVRALAPTPSALKRPCVCLGPGKSKLAGSKGSFSSWGYYGTECWSDPTLDMTVFVGTQLSPFWALPENRQELAGLIYGALVSTPAAKHFKGGTGDAGGGGMVRNSMSMFQCLRLQSAHLLATWLISRVCVGRG